MLDLIVAVALVAPFDPPLAVAVPPVTVKKKKLPTVKVKRPKTSLPDMKVKAAPSVKATPCDLSKAPPVSAVPQAPGLSKFRKAVLRKAAEEIGQVRVDEAGISIPPYTAKKGADRLLEYSIVAYGSAPEGWLAKALPDPKKPLAAPEMFRIGHKHTTWCGIFALWAAKTGAAVTADDYGPAIAGALGNPAIAVLAATFMDFYAPAWADGSKWAAMKTLEWRNGVGITVPVGGTRKQKLPTSVSTWFAKGEAPPIRPGDIGYVVIPVGDPIPGKWDGNSHHHFLVEKIHHTSDGHVIYYTIEGNFHNQQVKRWKRCYKSSEPIDAFYDLDALAERRPGPAAGGAEPPK